MFISASASSSLCLLWLFASAWVAATPAALQLERRDNSCPYWYCNGKPAYLIQGTNQGIGYITLANLTQQDSQDYGGAQTTIVLGTDPTDPNAQWTYYQDPVNDWYNIRIKGSNGKYLTMTNTPFPASAKAGPGYTVVTVDGTDINATASIWFTGNWQIVPNTQTNPPNYMTICSTCATGINGALRVGLFSGNNAQSSPKATWAVNSQSTASMIAISPQANGAPSEWMAYDENTYEMLLSSDNTCTSTKWRKVAAPNNAGYFLIAGNGNFLTASTSGFSCPGSNGAIDFSDLAVTSDITSFDIFNPPSMYLWDLSNNNIAQHGTGNILVHDNNCANTFQWSSTS